MIIKSNLFELRTLRGMSLPQLSRRCGVSISALNNIKNDVTDPKLSTLVVIARALKVYVNQLFTVEKL